MDYEKEMSAEELKARDEAIDYLLQNDPNWNIGKGKNKPQLLRMLVELKGSDRTWSRLASDTGVEKSLLWRIYRSNSVRISPRVIYSLTHNCAPGGEPRNGVTYEQLLIAAEHIDVDAESALSVDSVVDGMIVPQDEIRQKESREERIRSYVDRLTINEEKHRRHQEVVQKRREYESAVEITMWKALNAAKVHFEPVDAKNAMGTNYLRFPIKVIVDNEEILWGFVPMTDYKGDAVHLEFAVRDAIGHVMTALKGDKNIKVSFVTDDIDISKAFLALKSEERIRYRGEMSLIEIDRYNMAILREEILTHYDDNNPGVFEKKLLEGGQ